MSNRKFNSSFVLILSAVLLMVVFVVINFRDKSTNNTQDNSSSTSQAELVQGFPEFPIYPGAGVKRSHLDSDDSNYEAVFEVKEDTIEVMSWYMRQFEGNDEWTILNDPEVKPQSEYFIELQKDESVYYVTIESYEAGEVEIIVEVVSKELRGR